MSAQCGPIGRLRGPHTVWNDTKFFNGYRNAYGVADFNHQDSKIDPETGKKKPVYRWNFEELTKDIYQQHLEGKLSIGIQPCTEDSEVKFGVIDIDPKDYADFKKRLHRYYTTYELPLLPVESKSGGLHLFLFLDNFTDSKTVKSFLQIYYLCLDSNKIQKYFQNKHS